LRLTANFASPPSVIRVFRIVGLVLALCVFGGWMMVAVIAGISHHHLNSTGWVLLLGNSYIVWIIVRHLLPWAWEYGKTLPSVVERSSHG
jgi:hypothetical protein